MKKAIPLGFVLGGFCLLVAPASAGTLDATGVMSAVADGANWDYTIKLTDTGTGNIGTFWFSWVPGQGYLPSLPNSFVAPTGWVATKTDGPPPTDGYSIQYKESNTSFALTPGNSLLFKFTSADSPSTLAGLSTIHAPTPIGTSTIYGGAPFSDAGDRIVVTAAVPEPSTLTLGFLGLASLAALYRKRAHPDSD